MTSDRLPPQSRNAERALLGFMSRYPSKADEIFDAVCAEDLYFDPNRKIFDVLRSLHSRQQPLEPTAIVQELRDRKQLEDVGGEVYIAEMTDNATASPEFYVDVIRQKALRRGMIHAAVDVANESYDESSSADELLDRAQAMFVQLAARGSGLEATPIVDMVNRSLETIDARIRGERAPGLATGFSELDEALGGGLLRGGMTILAARPSVGKTTLAMQVARNACEAGQRVLFVSLEQPEQELSERFLSCVARVPGTNLRRGRIRSVDAERLSSAADSIRHWRLHVNDRPAQTAREIATCARMTKRKTGGLDLIAVDYLGLVEPENRKLNRNEQTGASARRLRDMARELNVPVLLCCQLNRDAADEKNAPRLHHLRDSGEIEQVADAVLILHRKARGTEGSDSIELHVAKQRNGPLALIEFSHETATYTFREAGIGA